MKLIVSVVLGLVASIIVYGLLIYAVGNIFDIHGCAALGPAFLAVMPISLLAGSIITGLLSYSTLTSKWWLPFIAPGLYLPMLAVSLNSASDTSELGWLLLLYLYWYLASLTGVALGYCLKAFISRR
jgi:hypothetical protein